jgi:transposase, IS605 orfB family
MILSKKIRCLPTPEQLIKFKKSAGTARFIYNLMLSENKKVYHNYLQSNIKSKSPFISGYDFGKYITELKKLPEYSWLSEVSSKVAKQACLDCDNAFKRFFKKLSNFPKFKKKGIKDSFYVRYDSIKATQRGFKCEKLGEIKTSEPIPKVDKYYNPHIVYDGKYWYITFGIDVPEKVNENNSGKTLGVDLGIKTFATVSDGTVISNINKSKKPKSIYRKIKYFQHKLTRCKKGSKNRIKVIKKLKLLYRRLRNIRQNHIHQATAMLVKTKPAKIVIECLNVLGMLKNRKLSRAISEAGFYEFARQLEYKCKLYGIDFLKADRFFPSSKLCCKCGCKKDNLKLSERTYHCEYCGNIMDRDLNASINLSYL